MVITEVSISDPRRRESTTSSDPPAAWGGWIVGISTALKKVRHSGIANDIKSMHLRLSWLGVAYGRYFLVLGHFKSEVFNNLILVVVHFILVLTQLFFKFTVQLLD